ncbi:MAG: hypothetical protein IID37_06635 [Planctomycetes bacterium]|nr:hypothetical protein [Planctomycetota bacterium]
MKTTSQLLMLAGLALGPVLGVASPAFGQFAGTWEGEHRCNDLQDEVPTFGNPRPLIIEIADSGSGSTVGYDLSTIGNPRYEFEAQFDNTSFSGGPNEEEPDTTITFTITGATLTGTLIDEDDALCEFEVVCETCNVEEPDDPEEEEVLCELPLFARWEEPGGGDFLNPEHWAIEAVPAAGFTVLFADNVVAGGQVAMGSDRVSDALIVEDDSVTLAIDGVYFLTESGGCVASVDVGFLPDPNPDIPTSKLTVIGGQIDAKSVLIGGDAGTTGRLTLVITEFNSETSCKIGGDGQGRLEVVEGALFHGADVELASNVFAEGFATVAGTDSRMQIDEKLVVGVRGTAFLDVFEDAALLLEDGAELIIGQGSGSTGTVLVSDPGSGILGNAPVTLGELSGSNGSLDVLGELASVAVGVIIVGKAGQGEIEVTDQAFIVCQQLTLAADEGSQGDVLVDGPGPTDEESRIEVDQFTVIAETGTASLTIRNGGFVLGGTEDGDQVASSIAATLGSRGTATVEGTGSTWKTKVLNVGFAGTGEMFIRDQAEVISEEAVVGNTEGAIGDVEITGGGRWLIEGRLIMAADGSIGRIQVDDTSVLSADEILVGPLGVLTGENVFIGSESGGPTNLRLQTRDTETPGIFTNRLVIEQGGIIEADQVTLGPGGELAGDGDLDLDVLNTGTLSPGLDECTTGVFSINGNYTQDSTATLRIKLGGRTLGDTHDTLLVNGVAELAGELHIDAINDFVPQPGDSFEILTADSVSGAFDSIQGSGEYEAVYENNRVLLTVRVSPTEVAATCAEPEEVITQPNLCGAGLCGSGMVPIAPLMVCGLGLLRLTNSRRPR